MWRNFDPDAYPFTRGELWEDSATGAKFWVARATQSVWARVDGERAQLVAGTAYLPLDNSFTDFWSFNESFALANGQKPWAPPQIRPEDFGAGETTNDNTAVQQAAIQASKTGGEVILSRMYKLSSTMAFNTGCVFRGLSRDNTGFQVSGAARANGATVNGVVSFRNLTFDMNQLCTSWGIQVQSGYFRAYECTFTNSPGPIAVAPGIRSVGTKMDIDKCEFANISTPVYIGGFAKNCRITRNWFHDWTMRGIYIIGDTDGAAFNLWITDNEFDGPTQAYDTSSYPRQPIAFQGVDTQKFRAIHIKGNILRGPGFSYNQAYDPSNSLYPGVADQISLHQCDSFEVIGNTCIGGGDVGITVSTQCQNGSVSDNTCVLNDTAGICIGSAQSTYTRNVALHGNTCINNGQNRKGDRPDYARTGINFYNATDISVSSRCGDDQSTKTQNYGISINKSQRIRIGGSANLVGNALAEIYQGTGSLVNTDIKRASMSDITGA
jgi:hypothetical protein